VSVSIHPVSVFIIVKELWNSPFPPYHWVSVTAAMIDTFSVATGAVCTRNK
jgi:hypothetical protein